MLVLTLRISNISFADTSMTSGRLNSWATHSITLALAFELRNGATIMLAYHTFGIKKNITNRTETSISKHQCSPGSAA